MHLKITDTDDGSMGIASFKLEWTCYFMSAAVSIRKLMDMGSGHAEIEIYWHDCKLQNLKSYIFMCKHSIGPQSYVRCRFSIFKRWDTK